jgi:hypothetical protein
MLFFSLRSNFVLITGGYHPVVIGDIYNHKYKVLQKAGWGHFSTVWHVLNLYEIVFYSSFYFSKNRNSKELGAMKVVRSAENYTFVAKEEIEMLKVVSSKISEGSKYCCSLLDNFVTSGPNGTHVCMVMDALGSNLLDLIKLFDYNGIPIKIIQHITKQILLGLFHLHSVCGLIHTDLKPENILLTRLICFTPDYDPEVKLKLPAPKTKPKGIMKRKKAVNNLAALSTTPTSPALESILSTRDPLLSSDDGVKQPSKRSSRSFHLSRGPRVRSPSPRSISISLMSKDGKFPDSRPGKDLDLTSGAKSVPNPSILDIMSSSTVSTLSGLSESSPLDFSGDAALKQKKNLGTIK